MIISVTIFSNLVFRIAEMHMKFEYRLFILTMMKKKLV